MNSTQKQFSLNRGASRKQFPLKFRTDRGRVLRIAALWLGLLLLLPAERAPVGVRRVTSLLLLALRVDPKADVWVRSVKLFVEARP
jgi:hypothetical protein